jgi:hypothetical protein
MVPGLRRDRRREHCGRRRAPEAALAAAREAGDQWGTAAALSTRAKLRYVRGDLKALSADGEESAALFRAIGDRWGLLQATAWLGGLAEMTGDRARAACLHREGLHMAEELGLWSEVSTPPRLAGLDRPAGVRLSAGPRPERAGAAAGR